jgi:hypothetical protein
MLVLLTILGVSKQEQIQQFLASKKRRPLTSDDDELRGTPGSSGAGGSRRGSQNKSPGSSRRGNTQWKR